MTSHLAASGRSVRLDLLVAFLYGQGWSLIKEGSRSSVYAPPKDLDLKDFEITVPTRESGAGTEVVLARLTATLAKIHGISSDQLMTVMSEPSTVAAIKFIGPQVEFGSIPLVQFENIVDRFKNLLLDVASFVITDDPIAADTVEEAQDYVNACRFLQTEAGSYVAKVQLPRQELLGQPTLFSDPVSATEVTDRVESIIQFVMRDVLRAGRELFSDDALERDSDFVNISALKDIADLLERAEAEEIGFTFVGTSQIRRMSSGLVTPERTAHLREYISFARERLARDVELDVTGRVVELRARRRDRRRNHVGVQGVSDGRPVFVTFRLSATAYQEAVHAHHQNLNVRVIGTSKRLRRQFRISRVASFEVVRPPEETQLD